MISDLPRNDWMVIGRALQDRVAVLEAVFAELDRKPSTLCEHEINKCQRIRRLVDAHVDATWTPPR